MKFIKKIREEFLGKSSYEMHRILGFRNTKSYQDFENSTRAVNVEKLIKFWKLSGLSGDEFMQMMAEEVSNNNQS